MTRPRLDGPDRLTPGPGPLTGPGRLGLHDPARRRRRLTAASAAAAVLLLLLTLLAAGRTVAGLRPPTSIADAVLAGPRGPQCLRLIVAGDMSGSMDQYADARDTALAQLIPWGRDQLRPNDQVALIEWADTATTTLPPTALTAAAVPATRPDVGGTTHLDPVITAVENLPPTTCRTHLVLLSDGQADDLTTAGDLTRLAAAGIDQISLLLPSPDLDPPAEFIDAFPYAATQPFDGLDPEDTALTLAHAIATSTSQHVERR